MMKKICFILLCIFYLVNVNNPTYALDMKMPTLLKGNVFKDDYKPHKNESKTLWAKIKGEPTQDAVNLGMFSFHTLPNRDELNESNKLFGLDYKGYSIGTFNNSYHVQTYYIGLTRKIFEKKLPFNTNMQLKYKVVAMHGYGRFEPDVMGITPTIIPVIGFNTKFGGVDFLISQGKTATFATNFRINLDALYR